ncbi:hypothetical protein CMV_021899, partial [Castanea mollissima]
MATNKDRIEKLESNMQELKESVQKMTTESQDLGSSVRELKELLPQSRDNSASHSSSKLEEPESSTQWRKTFPNIRARRATGIGGTGSGGTRKISWEEMQKQREKGLCFSCNEKCTPGHRCAASQALLTEVCPQQEFVEESFDKLEEGVVKDHEDCKEEAPLISLHAIAGCSSPRTMQVKAKIGKRELVVLIDNGSTHNFMSHSLGLAVMPITEFNVKVANGESLVCKERYEQVSSTIQGFKFSTTLYSLPFNGPDSVLGPIECDWKKMTMKFLWEGVSYVIKSSSVNPIKEVAMQRLERDVQGGGELFAIMQKGEDHVGGSIVPAELQPLLHEFHQVLEEPRTLPPSREFDHQIPLKEGTTPVN